MGLLTILLSYLYILGFSLVFVIFLMVLNWDIAGAEYPSQKIQVQRRLGPRPELQGPRLETQTLKTKSPRIAP
jgi:hypothetical protein